MVAGTPLGLPIYRSIRVKHTVPHVEGNPEIPSPHVVSMVEVVDRSRQPEHETVTAGESNMWCVAEGLGTCVQIPTTRPGL